MILRINSAEPVTSIPANKRSLKKLHNTENNVTNPNNTELSGVPMSYISFRGAEEKKELKFLDDAKFTLDLAKQFE